MPKYRASGTGKVVVLPEHYVSVFSEGAYTLVPDDTPVDIIGGCCGADEDMDEQEEEEEE